MEKKGFLIIISAPSGTGKTSVIRKLLDKHPDLIHSISATTRPMRPGDVEGKDYHFISKNKFESGIENNEFAEWAHVHDHLYGTPRQPLDDALKQGKKVLLDLDVVGGTKLKQLYKEKAVSIFLLPPSNEELKNRLLNRATDSKQQQELRLKNALHEITYKDKYDYQVINDSLEQACKKIEEIIYAD